MSPVRDEISEARRAYVERSNPFDLLDTTDGQVWADDFVRRFAGRTIAADDVDAEIMAGWFGNAIETGRRTVAGRRVTADQLEDRFFAALLAADPAGVIRALDGMVTVDPDRAGHLIGNLRTALALAPTKEKP